MMWTRRREWEDLKVTLKGALEGIGHMDQRVRVLESELSRAREVTAALGGKVETLKELIFGTPTQTPSKEAFTDEEALAIERMAAGGANQLVGDLEGELRKPKE